MEYFFQQIWEAISLILSNKNSHSIIVSNALLCAVLALPYFTSKFLIDTEFRRIKKVKDNKFDKIIMLFLGIVTAVFCSGFGLEVLAYLTSAWSFRLPISNVVILPVAMFSAISVFVYTLVNFELLSAKLTRLILEDSFCTRCHRITTVSFLIIAATLNIQAYSPRAATIYALVGIPSAVMLIYYLAEIYFARNIISQFFIIERTSEYSIGAHMVNFVNSKFVYILALGMTSVLFSHLPASQQTPNPIEELCDNICIIFSCVIVMIVLQSIAAIIVNRVIRKLESLESGKNARNSELSRRKNLIWICDVLTVYMYLTAVVVSLWYVGIHVEKYIFDNALMKSALVIFATVTLYNAFKEFSSAMIEKAKSGHKERLVTFMPIISIIVNVFLVGISLCTVLSMLGVDILPLFTALAAIGLAVGNAAKDIIKGFLQGITLLLENQFCVGDFVTINNITGIVTNISVRVLTIRAPDGSLHIIPYDIVKSITNHSRGYFCHSEHLLLSPDTDIEKASNLLQCVVEELRQDPKFSDIIYEDVKIHGVKLSDREGVRLYWTLKTDPSIDGHLLNYEIYDRLLKKFQKEGIKVPFAGEMKLLKK